MKPRWVFTELHNGRSPSWTWSRYLSNGPVESASQPFDGYGQAVMSAIAHGFRPKEEAWCVKNANGIVSVFNAEPQTFLSTRKKPRAPPFAESPNTATPPASMPTKHEGQ